MIKFFLICSTFSFAFCDRYGFLKVTECKDIFCENGGFCKDYDFGFRCICRPGYGGRICQNKLDPIIYKSRPSSPTDITLFRFGKHVYRIVLIPQDFYTANATCQQNGGYLACLSTLKEYEYIHEMFSAISVFYQQAWVGFEWLFDGACDETENGMTCPWRYRCIDRGVDDEGFDHWYNEKAMQTRYFRPIPHEPVDGWAITKGDAPIWEMFNYDTKYPFVCEYEDFCMADIACKNGGKCSAENNLHYTCNCSSTAHSGSFCEFPVCSSGYGLVCPCASNPCENGAICKQLSSGYTCDCSGTGYGGSRCSEDVNECADPGLCSNHGFCSNTAGSYTCGCRTGYSGDHCEKGGLSKSTLYQCQERSMYMGIFLLVLGLFVGLMLCLSSLYLKRLRIRINRARMKKHSMATIMSASSVNKESGRGSSRLFTVAAAAIEEGRKNADARSSRSQDATGGDSINARDSFPQSTSNEQTGSDGEDSKRGSLDASGVRLEKNDSSSDRGTVGSNSSDVARQKNGGTSGE